MEKLINFQNFTIWKFNKFSEFLQFEKLSKIQKSENFGIVRPFDISDHSLFRQFSYFSLI